MSNYSSLKEHLTRWYVMFVQGGFGSAREFAEHQGMTIDECELLLTIGQKYYNIKQQEDED